MGQAQALGIAGTVCVAEGHGECPLPARLRTQVGEAPVSAVGRNRPVRSATASVGKAREAVAEAFRSRTGFTVEI